MSRDGFASAASGSESLQAFETFSRITASVPTACLFSVGGKLVSAEVSDKATVRMRSEVRSSLKITQFCGRFSQRRHETKLLTVDLLPLFTLGNAGCSLYLSRCCGTVVLNTQKRCLCLCVCVFEAADLTSQPAKEVVVVLRRQIRENILDPPPKLENQDRDVHFKKTASCVGKYALLAVTALMCLHGKHKQAAE